MLNLIERSFIVPVSLETAWDHFARVEEWPSWAKHIKSLNLTSGGALAEHSSGMITLQNGIRSSFSMTEFDPPEHWKWVGPFLWLTVYYAHRFRPISDDQCEMTFHVAGEGFAVGIAGRLFAMIYNRNLDVAIPNLIQEMRDLA